MPNKCCVPGCTGSFRTGKKGNLFSFPRDENTLKEWIRAIQRKDFVPSSYSKVCSGHFEASCVLWHTTYTDPKTGRVIQVSLPRPRLRPGSVPTLFPDCFSLCRGRKRHNHCATAAARVTLNTGAENGTKSNTASQPALLPLIAPGTILEVEPLQLVTTVLQELLSPPAMPCNTKWERGTVLPTLGEPDARLRAVSSELCKTEQEKGASLPMQLGTRLRERQVLESCKKEQDMVATFPSVSNETDLLGAPDSCEVEQERRATCFSSLEELDLCLRGVPMRESWIVVRRKACILFLSVVGEHEPCLRASVTVFSDLRVRACYRGSPVKVLGIVPDRVGDLGALLRVLDNLCALSDDSDCLSATMGVLFDKLEHNIGEEKREHLRFLKDQVLFLANGEEEATRPAARKSRLVGMDVLAS